MKKTMLLLALCAVALSFNSCLSEEAENDLAGHRFEYRYEDGDVTYYEFSPYDYKVKSGDTGWGWEFEFSYTYKNKIIYMYKDGKLLLTAEYYGDYITRDDGWIFVKVW